MAVKEIIAGGVVSGSATVDVVAVFVVDVVVALAVVVVDVVAETDVSAEGGGAICPNAKPA